MAEIEGLDALIVLLVCAFTCLFILWALWALRFQFTFSQFLFLGMFFFILGIFVESWVRNTREQVLSAVLLVLLMIIYLFMKVKDKARRRFASRKTRAGALLPILLIPMVSLAFAAGPAQAWDKGMHPDLVEQGLLCLSNDGHGEIYQFFQAQDRNGVTIQQWICDGSEDADRLDLCRNHYYDPYTGLGLSGFQDAANLSQAMFDRAVELYADGDWAGSAYYLGRGVHMVADCCVPHHVHLDALNGHVDFEDWAYENWYDFAVSSGAAYDASSAWEICHSSALEAYGLYDKVLTSNASEANYRDVAGEMIPLAIRSTASYIELYYRSLPTVGPFLKVSEKTSTSISLAWSPSPDPDFVEYRLYGSGVQEDVSMDEEHLIWSSSSRDENSLLITDLTTYGRYRFQVVTEVGDQDLGSEVLEVTLGVSGIAMVALVLIVGMVGVAIVLRAQRRPAGRRRK